MFVPTFEEFFRDTYQPLVRDVIFAGWDPDEAEGLPVTIEP